MNILPLILGFIIIFTCLAAPFFKRARSLETTKTQIRAFGEVERSLMNEIEKRAYDKAPKDTSKTPSHNDSPPPLPRKQGDRRLFNPRVEQGKFNLALLLVTPNPKESPFYPVALEFLHVLYGHLPKFPYDALLAEMATTLLALKQNPNKQEITLYSLFPKDKNLQKTYYQILKGTSVYTPGKEGVPPLGEYVTCNLSQRKPSVNIVFASHPLLQALFPKKIAEDILEIEAKKRAEDPKFAALKKQDFQKIFLRSPKIAPLEPYFDFSARIPAKETVNRQHPKNGLSMRKKIPITVEKKEKM